MPEGLPAWAADFAWNGHGGTYNDLDGGEYGVVGSHWLKWVLFGDKESAEYFKTDKASSIGWTNFQKKNLDKIPTI